MNAFETDIDQMICKNKYETSLIHTYLIDNGIISKDDCVIITMSNPYQTDGVKLNLYTYISNTPPASSFILEIATHSFVFELSFIIRLHFGFFRDSETVKFEKIKLYNINPYIKTAVKTLYESDVLSHPKWNLFTNSNFLIEIVKRLAIQNKYWFENTTLNYLEKR